MVLVRAHLLVEMVVLLLLCLLCLIVEIQYLDYFHQVVDLHDPCELVVPVHLFVTGMSEDLLAYFHDLVAFLLPCVFLLD